jgi:biopolymer transport protein ExbB/TolQ
MAVVRSAFLWGALASLGFFILIHTDTLRGEFFKRYFAGHWINYTETIMFFVGLSLLILRSCDLAEQRFSLKKKPFDDVPPLGDAAAESRALLGQLDQLPVDDRQGYLPRRLREALETVIRKGTADDLENELKYLSDVDGGRAHSGYAMVRLIIWAIPILGFLGTVIGITMAIAALDPKALEKSMDVVTKGLGVAFDTTALALALSMCLMFVQYFVDKQENTLLADVDERTLELLSVRLPTSGSDADPQLHAVRRMAEAVIVSVEQTVGRQADLWQQTIAVAEQRWSEVTGIGREQLEESFGRAISRSMETHRKHLLASETELAEHHHKHWASIVQSLDACTASTRAQQNELNRQAEMLLRVLDATNHVGQLENLLNRNLASLAASQHLQETLANLSAAVNLLNSRLERLAPASTYLPATTSTPASKAA